MSIRRHNRKEKGFALLFAVLVSSVLLSIGISIFNLTLKELILSSSGRESQFAFYSADTGAECALYWDFKSTTNVMFATSTYSQTNNWRDASIDSENPTCVSVALASDFKNPIQGTQTSAQTRFSLTIPNTDYLGNSAPYCAIVTVTKSETGGIIGTTIDSRGYNTACDSTDVNRVERALRVAY
jgi:Tfp pilus assembly protein PilX